MSFPDLSSFLSHLEASGELIRLEEEFDPRHEVCAVLNSLDASGGPAVLFEKLKGQRGKVVGNLLGTRRRLALALETIPSEIGSVYLERKAQRIPAEVVASGPIKDVVITQEIDILKTLPVLTYHEKDANPYITAGVCIAKDPISGIQSMGVHRLEVKGPNRLGVLLVSPPLAEFFARAEERDQPLEIAIAIGLDPAMIFAAVAWVPVGDKFEVAGALRREPVWLTRAETVDLEVPAGAEVVIEGRVLPKVREKEGPFGETTGYYFAYESPVIEVSAITHRAKPIFHAIHPMSADAFMLIGPSWEAELRNSLRSMIPRVQAVHLTPESCCSHAIISIQKRSKAEARRVLITTLMNNPYIKHAVIVDDDVDVYNHRDVEWALATRFQGDRDLVVIPEVEGSAIDPSTKPGVITCKVGFDATTPTGESGRFERMALPPEAEAKAKAILEKYLTNGAKANRYEKPW